MTPKRPYLLRAFYEWLSDNEMTPHLMVDATHPEVLAPMEYAQEGKLVLNISNTATKALHIANDSVHFSARFAGVSQEVWLPMACVMGIYAREDHSCAIFFDPEEYPIASAKTTPTPSPTKSPFTVIK